MRIPWFKAVVKNIYKIKKTDGSHIAYLYIYKPPYLNDMNVEVEPEQNFMVVVGSDKLSLLKGLSRNTQIKILVHLNSKTVINKYGNEHIFISMRLCKLNIINHANLLICSTRT